MKFYVVKDEYISYLRNFDNKVMINKNSNHIRPYFGIVTVINSQKYLVPLSSPKYLNDFCIKNYNSKFLPKDFPNPRKYKIEMLKHSYIPVYYLIDKNKSGNIDLLGKLKFNAMIPVCDSVIYILDIYAEKDIKYKNMLIKQYNHLRNREKYLLENHAKIIYNQKARNIDKGYIIKATVNFKLLEEKCKEWQKSD